MRSRFDYPKAASAIQTAVTSTSTATELAPDRAYRGAIMLINNSDQTVFIGYTSSVSTSNGIPLSPSAALMEDRWNGPIYGIVSSGSADMRVIELL